MENNFRGSTVSHAFHLRLFAVPNQSAKNMKIMRLENLALYGICIYVHIYCVHSLNSILYMYMELHVYIYSTLAKEV